MKQMKWSTVAVIIPMLAIAVALTGCKRKQDEVLINPDYNSGGTTTGDAETTTGTGLPLVDQERLVFDKASGLQPIYFDYDRFDLRPDAREVLQRNSELIKANPDVIVQIEGHCDERGTQEYNFVLGEKRALATRDYLIQLGVGGDRLVTISYGEEVPAAQGTGEAAWAQNRRCEFNNARR